MARKWQNKYEKLEQELEARLRELVAKRGVKSQFSSEMVLKVKEPQMINLDGGRYLTEIHADRLIDSSGYRYFLGRITLKELAEVVDNI